MLTTNYAVINATQDIGTVLGRNHDDTVKILALGVEGDYMMSEITFLDEASAMVLDVALREAAQAIDLYYHPDMYGPAYNEEGVITYSNAARAALRAIGLPALILALHQQSETIAMLRRGR